MVKSWNLCTLDCLCSGVKDKLACVSDGSCHGTMVDQQIMPYRTRFVKLMTCSSRMVCSSIPDERDVPSYFRILCIPLICWWAGAYALIFAFWAQLYLLQWGSGPNIFINRCRVILIFGPQSAVHRPKEPTHLSENLKVRL